MDSHQPDNSSGSSPAKADPLTLLRRNHRLIKLTKEKTPSDYTVITLSVERTHLEDLIKDIKRQNPSYAELPIVFFSVLGNNKAELRALHTDWLIHHSIHHERQSSDKDHEIYKLWKPPYGSIDKYLKYVGQFGSKSNKPEEDDESGVYIWPTPFILTEQQQGTGKPVGQEFLCFILYSIVGVNDDGQGSTTLDYLTASIASRIVVFKEAEREKQRTFMKAATGGSPSPFTSFVISPGAMALVSEKNATNLENGWKKLMQSLRNSKPILESKGNMSTLPTLKSLVDHLEKSSSAMNAGNILIHGLAKDVSKASAEDNQLQRCKTEVDTETPNEQNDEDVHTTIDDFGEELRRWLTEDIMMPHKDTDILQHIDMREPGMMECLSSLQTVINGYNVELQNMFDNYVCFGPDNERQMTRFQQQAEQREQQNWMSYFKNNSQTFQIVDQLHTRICQWLTKRYTDDNENIIKCEDKLTGSMCRKLARVHLSEMNKILDVKGYKVKEVELVQIHLRMRKQCMASLTRCMNYGGKLNNVVSIIMKLFINTLNKQFEEIKSKVEIIEDTPTEEQKPQRRSDHPDHIQAIFKYMTEIHKGLETAKPEELSRLHDLASMKSIGGLEDKLERYELDARLITYLTYQWELHQEQIQRGVEGKEEALPSLCIHLTDDKLKLLKRGSHGWTFVQFKQQGQQQNVERSSNYCPATVSWIKGKFSLGHEAKRESQNGKGKDDFQGTIFGCMRGIPKEEVLADMMRALFAHLIKLSEVGSADALVIIPSWFSDKDRNLLRSAAGRGGLRKIFLVNESTLVANHLLNKSKARLVLVVIARVDVVIIEIFALEKNESAGEYVSMVGLASAHWTSEGESVVDPHRPPQNFKKVLEGAVERGMRQVPENLHSSKKICFVMTCYHEWMPHFTSALKVSMAVAEESSTDDFVIDAIRRFGSGLTGIRTKLVDYAIPKLSLSEMGKLAEMGTDTESSTSGLSPQQQDVLDACAKMEAQLENGEVRAGVLTKRIILETLDRVRVAVKTGEDAEKEVEDLNELIKQHNFVIN